MADMLSFDIPSVSVLFTCPKAFSSRSFPRSRDLIHLEGKGICPFFLLKFQRVGLVWQVSTNGKCDVFLCKGFWRFKTLTLLLLFPLCWKQFTIKPDERSRRFYSSKKDILPGKH